jgi:glycine cleavage system transcriptional repressor
MHVAVTAVGRDRPGIVAAVSKVLHAAGCNVEDSRMAILGGHFAMMLIVALPSDTGATALEEALGEPALELDLVVSVRPVTEAEPGHADGQQFVVSVYGADHPGIVARVTELLAGRRVNISDLATQIVGNAPPVYAMVMEVVLPAGADPGDIEADLKALASELEVDVSMRAMEPETF